MVSRGEFKKGRKGNKLFNTLRFVGGTRKKRLLHSDSDFYVRADLPILRNSVGDKTLKLDIRTLVTRPGIGTFVVAHYVSDSGNRYTVYEREGQPFGINAIRSEDTKEWIPVKDEK